MKTDKAREFWLNKYTCEFHIGRLSEDDIHVIEYTAYEQLEQKVKELELKLEYHNKIVDHNIDLNVKLAAQERVIEKQAQELDKLYPLLSKICTVSNGLSFYVRNEFNEAKLQSDDQSDLAKRLWDLYNIQCDLEQLTKESK